MDNEATATKPTRVAGSAGRGALLGAMFLWAAARRSGDLRKGYAYPKWLLVIGILVWLLTVYLGWKSLGDISDLWG